MKLYLVNKNPIITKLVTLSANKIGLNIEESQEIDITSESDILLLDDECYDESLFNSYKSTNSDAKSILFFSKSTDRIAGFDEYIQKPFLPTDLLKLLSNLTGISTDGDGSSGELSEMSDDFSSFGNDDSLDSLDLDDDMDLSGLDDLGLDDDGDVQMTNNEASILDKSDVDEIKNLLDEDVDSDYVGSETENITREKGLLEDIGVSLDIDEDNQLENPMDGANESFDFNDSGIDESNIEGNNDIADGSSDVSGKLGDDLLDTLDLGGESSNGLADSDIADDISSSDDIDNGMISVADSDMDLIGDVAGEDQDEIKSDDLLSELQDAIEDKASEIDDVNTIDDVGNEISNIDVTNDGELGDQDIIGDIGESNVDANDDNSELINDTDLMDVADIQSDIMKENDMVEENDANDMIDGLDMDLADDSLLAVSEGKIDSVEAQVDLKDNISSQDSDNEFSSLSLEGLSEALGEPLTKEPNVAPIVPADDKPKQTANLPTDISANSIEGLIGALQALQTQSLKELLNGATINISIQFPNKENK